MTFDDFDQAGDFNVITMASGSCTLFLPVGVSNPAAGLGWGNGTGASPSVYSGILNRVASFGFYVTAANTSNAGSGVAISNCINQGPNIPFTASGHSQGGSGAINASALNGRVENTCPVQLDGVFTANSDPDDIEGTNSAPAAIMCGGGDFIASCDQTNNGDTKFEQADVCRSQITIPGDGHGAPAGSGGDYAGIVTACVAAAGGDGPAAALLRAPAGVENWQTRTADCN